MRLILVLLGLLALLSLPDGLQAQTSPSACAGLYLGDDLPGAPHAPGLDVLTQRLSRLGMRTRRVSSAQMGDPATFGDPSLRILLADLRRVPAASVEPLLRWMNGGGLLVSLAAPAFGEPLWQADGRWYGWEAYCERLAQGIVRGARPAITWAADGMAAWSQVRGGDARLAASPAVRAGATPDGGAALDLRVAHFRSGWWALSTTLGAPAMRPGEELTCFWVRGDGKTPALSVEWTEEDHSRWVATVRLTDRWRCCVLPPSAFRYWPDNPSKGRGGPGDRLHPEHAVGIQFGISGTHTPEVLAADAAEHRILIGTVGASHEAAEVMKALSPFPVPDLEALSPGYKLHEVRGAARWEPTNLGKLWGIPATGCPGAFGAVARPSGSGSGRGRWWRWVPLIRAVDSRVNDLGAPLSVILSDAPEMPHSAWVSLCLRDASALASPALQQAVAAVVERLVRSPVLFEGGTAHYLIRPGEGISLGVRLLNPTGEAQHLKLRFAIAPAAASPRQPVTARLSREAVVAPHEMGTARLQAAPLPAGLYQVTTEAWQGSMLVDRIAQPLRVVARLPAAPPPASVVRREGGRLLLSDKPWHPVGMNYWPHYLGGMPGAAYWQNWLSPLLYDPAVVEPDLAQIESWSVRAIAAVAADFSWGAGDDNAHIRNLEDFLWRCERHHIKVFLFCPGLDPRAPDDEKARRVIRAVRGHPAVAAYDIAWEPSHAQARFQVAAQWGQWLALHYGSVAGAEKALEYALPRTQAGEADVPPDAWCVQDGPWRGVTAAYRAFMNWQMGAGYRHSVALIRSLDPVHLIGFRGNSPAWPAGFLPVEQPAVLHFVDFSGPEGYEVPAYGRLTDWPVVSSRGLATRMLSFLSGGKPVIWMEFGLPIYANGTEWSNAMLQISRERLDYQVGEANRFWRMQRESGAWGSFAWWYTGGFRVGENSDCGLVDPANRPRPVATALRRAVPGFAAVDAWRPDTWLEFRPESSIGGWTGEYLRLRDEYARQTAAGHHVGVRTAGEGLTSDNAPRVDPAGRPWKGLGPLRYLDSVFERIRIGVNGAWQDVPLPVSPEPVEVAVPPGASLTLEGWAGNTAEARWLAGPGGVRLQVSGDRTAGAALLAPVAFQGSGHFAPVDLPRMDGPLTLRLQLATGDGVPFGEAVLLRMRPQ